jgi:hypothetical protein
VFEEKVLLKLKHKVLGIAGHTEHERTLSQSERAQKELVEFGLITCDANLSKATLHKQTRSGVKLVQDRPNKRRRFADARWYATKQETIRIRVVSRLEGLAYEAITVPLHPYDRRPARMQLR